MRVDISATQGKKEKQNSREMRDSLGDWTYTHGRLDCRIRMQSCEGSGVGPEGSCEDG